MMGTDALVLVACCCREAAGACAGSRAPTAPGRRCSVELYGVLRVRGPLRAGAVASEMEPSVAVQTPQHLWHVASRALEQVST